MHPTTSNVGKSKLVAAVWGRRRIIVVLLIGVPCVWLLTATWGVSDVVAAIDRGAQGLNTELGPLRRLDFDPDVRPSRGESKMPWYFIGNASSPFPCIIAVDFAYQVAPTAGQRSRVYFFWCFGLKLGFHHRVDWMS